MHSTQMKTWLTRMALMVLSATTLLAGGCARVYHATHYNPLGRLAAEHRRPYFHSQHTGRIIVKEHGHFCPVEPPCFGFEPTCWSPWPARCPQQCHPPCLVDESIRMEQVVGPQQSVIAPEEMPVQPATEQPDAASPPGVDPPRPEPTTIRRTNPREDTSWSETEPARNPGDSKFARPLQKQPLAEQLVGEPLLLPSAEEVCPTAVWDANIARREINQQLVLVDEPSAVFNYADDSPVSVPEPQLVEARVPATAEPTPEPIPEFPAASPDPAPAVVEPPRSERLALRTETVDRPAPPRPSHDELPTDATVQPAVSEPPNVPANENHQPAADPPPHIQTTTGAPPVPSFKITAVTPPKRQRTRAITVITVKPPTSDSHSTIRFASEKVSSARVGALKTKRTSASLRFLKLR